jgi:predicted DCC family thiol-disulfide oxidoreductase YuxK
MKSYNNLILFDGVCNLCNHSVNMVIDHDKNNVFRFTSLQSEIGQKILAENNLNTTEFHSFVFIQHGKVYQQSTAALKVAITLGGWWKCLGIFLIVPPFIRNAVYAIISKNRYRWFGKQESCRMPTPELKSKFL